MLNEITFQSKVDRSPANVCIYLRSYDILILWPWPWPDDLDIRIWPILKMYLHTKIRSF